MKREITLLGLVCLFSGGLSAETILRRPGAWHALRNRVHVGTASIAVSKENGRMWATWYAGCTPGEDFNSYAVLATSEDGGTCWREMLVADPDGPGPRRAFDPEARIAPDGKLCWSWTESSCDSKAPRRMSVEMNAETEPNLPLAVRFDETCSTNRSRKAFSRRLASGNILLVKNGKIDEDCGRKDLTAFLSDDDGKTWKGGLVLDERTDVACPDGDQRADGRIVVAYDHDRFGDREILYAEFTEKDVLAGSVESAGCGLKNLISAARLDTYSAERATLSRRICGEGSVLLKNDGALPLKKGSKVAVFGPAVGEWLSCGGMSARVNPAYTVLVPDGLANAGFVLDPTSRETAVYLVSRTCGRGGEPDLEAYEWKDAETYAAWGYDYLKYDGCSYSLVGVGTGATRNFLPFAVLADIKAMGFKRIVVVLNTGVALATRHLAKDPSVSAVLQVGFAGMEGGNAVADILSGAVNPSGRLVQTLAERTADYPADANWQASTMCLTRTTSSSATVISRRSRARLHMSSIHSAGD